MTLRAVIVPVTAFAQNCSVIWCDQTGRGAVIDPGGDLERIMAVVAEHGVELEKILLTHAHIDHAGAAAALSRRAGLPIEGPHPGDRFWIEQLPRQGAMFGLPASEAFEPTRWLDQGDTVQVGGITLEVRHCPGHTPGHVVFFEPASRIAFVGDVLFAGSIGRSDFPRRRPGHAARLHPRQSPAARRRRAVRAGAWTDVDVRPGAAPRTPTFGLPQSSP